MQDLKLSFESLIVYYRLFAEKVAGKMNKRTWIGIIVRIAVVLAAIYAFYTLRQMQQKPAGGPIPVTVVPSKP
jgi:hypothetical protein